MSIFLCVGRFPVNPSVKNQKAFWRDCSAGPAGTPVPTKIIFVPIRVILSECEESFRYHFYDAQKILRRCGSSE